MVADAVEDVKKAAVADDEGEYGRVFVQVWMYVYGVDAHSVAAAGLRHHLVQLGPSWQKVLSQQPRQDWSLVASNPLLEPVLEERQVLVAVHLLG